jgi:hypothetical protein
VASVNRRTARTLTMCFANPTRMGNKPSNSNSVQRDYLRPESINAGLTPLGWHTLPLVSHVVS